MNGIRFYPVIFLRLVRYGIRAGCFKHRRCKINVKKASSKYFYPYTDSTNNFSHPYNNITNEFYFPEKQAYINYML